MPKWNSPVIIDDFNQLYGLLAYPLQFLYPTEHDRVCLVGEDPAYDFEDAVTAIKEDMKTAKRNLD